MKREMELVRKLMMKIRDKNDLVPRPIELDNIEQIVVNRHLELLINAKLVEGIVQSSGQDHSIHVVVRDLTNAGHDFLSILENDSVWGKIKNTFSPIQLASIPFAVISSVGTELLKKWAMGLIN